MRLSSVGELIALGRAGLIIGFRMIRATKSEIALYGILVSVLFGLWGASFFLWKNQQAVLQQNRKDFDRVITEAEAFSTDADTGMCVKETLVRGAKCEGQDAHCLDEVRLFLNFCIEGSVPQPESCGDPDYDAEVISRAKVHCEHWGRGDDSNCPTILIPLAEYCDEWKYPLETAELPLDENGNIIQFSIEMPDDEELVLEEEDYSDDYDEDDDTELDFKHEDDEDEEELDDDEDEDEEELDDDEDEDEEELDDEAEDDPDDEDD